MSLVKLLALKPLHSLHREQIIDLIWTETPAETAVNNLNKAIYQARRVFEPELEKGSHSKYILTGKNQVTLASPGSIRVDLDEFEKLAGYFLKSSDLESGRKAVELYRDDLLVEDIYEDWIYTRRESMRILYRKTATKTAEIYAENGNFSKSIELLKKLILADGTDEYVHRLLMRFYAETGGKYEALKQFEQCRAALENIGIEPEPKTVELEQVIKRGEILPALKEDKPLVAANSSPEVIPLTFQNGIINSARFLSDGKTVVLSAAWESNVSEVYSLALGTNEIHTLEISDAEVYSVSSAGDIALALKPVFWSGFIKKGTLAVVPSGGAQPFKLLDDVLSAEWHPSKNFVSDDSFEKFLAVVRESNGKVCLEFPIGNVIFETGGWISHPRFSSDGKKIAFIEHPIPYDDEGHVVVLDLEKNNENRNLTERWLTIFGLAWFKDEIWFTASRESSSRSLNAVNQKGVERFIYRGIGNLRLHDFSENGEILITDERYRFHLTARHFDDKIERDLSWHEGTFPRDISHDGKILLIEEGGVTESTPYFTFIRKTDGTSTRKIGNGAPMALSPDNKYALVRMPQPHNRLELIEIETGKTIPLETDPENSLIYQAFGSFFPDGKRIIFAANKPNRGTQIYVQNIEGGTPVCITPDEEGLKLFARRSISPDGKSVILKNYEDRLFLYQIADGTSAPLKHLGKDFYLNSWSEDDEHIFIRRWKEIPEIIYKYDLVSGEKEKWLELTPKDKTGVNMIMSVQLTPDGKSYVYHFKRQLSDLYLLKDFQ